ncbi:hypothetical protein JCM12298_25720 [Desulfothermus naphthae]
MKKIYVIYHRIDKRITGHIFLTILAYHLLCVIQRRLRQRGISKLGETIRRELSTIIRVTTTMITQEGKTIHLRQITELESFQLEIYNALELPLKPLSNILKIN